MSIPKWLSNIVNSIPIHHSLGGSNDCPVCKWTAVESPCRIHQPEQYADQPMVWPGDVYQMGTNRRTIWPGGGAVTQKMLEDDYSIHQWWCKGEKARAYTDDSWKAEQAAHDPIPAGADPLWQPCTSQDFKDQLENSDCGGDIARLRMQVCKLPPGTFLS